MQSGSDSAKVAATATAGLPSIAVLPFADMSPEKDQDYFCEGMAEEITNAIAGLEGLHVASRTAAFQAKARVSDAIRVGRACIAVHNSEG